MSPPTRDEELARARRMPSQIEPVSTGRTFLITIFVVLALAAAIGYSQGWFSGVAAVPMDDATEQVGVAPQTTGSDVLKGPDAMPNTGAPSTVPPGSPDARPAGDGGN